MLRLGREMYIFRHPRSTLPLYSTPLTKNGKYNLFFQNDRGLKRLLLFWFLLFAFMSNCERKPKVTTALFNGVRISDFVVDK